MTDAALLNRNNNTRTLTRRGDHRIDAQTYVDDENPINVIVTLYLVRDGDGATSNDRVAEVRRDRRYGEIAVTVNWSAWGAQGPQIARAFADALQHAANIAEDLRAVVP